MCRINIRNRIGLQSLKFLEDLPIAKVMKDYLKHKFDNVWWQEFFLYIYTPPPPNQADGERRSLLSSDYASIVLPSVVWSLEEVEDQVFVQPPEVTL